ncbi:MAG: hypothetical protein Q9181_001170 [Wetmoreana brouardii]
MVRCSNIPPGACCETPDRASPGFRTVTYYGLTALDIAAIWHSNLGDVYAMFHADDVVGCSGTVLESGIGQVGEWTWNATLTRPGQYIPDLAHGASYLSLPESLPPAPDAVPALTIQGLLGFVWGGRRVVVDLEAKRLPGGLTSYPHSRKVRRGIRSSLKGTVYARPPRKVMYPSSMTINGTEYSDGGAGNFMYKDAAGNTLNLKDWFR